jgi:SAM-dependent methyltransferase
MPGILAPVDRETQKQRIDYLVTHFPSLNQPRDDIRSFVTFCAHACDIEAPVLDVGCGYRSNEPEICTKKLLDFYTLDANPAYAPDFICDASDMDVFESDVFGCVVCTEMLEHTERPAEVIEEVYRVLKKGGLFIVTVPFWIPIHENSAQNDYWRFTPKAVRLLLKRFEIHAIETSGREDTPTGVFALAQK